MPSKEYYEAHRAECIAKATEWNKAHPEKRRETVQKWTDNNYDHYRAKNKEWKDNNRDRVNTCQNAIRKANPVKTFVQAFQSYDNNINKHREDAIEYQLENPEYYAQKRREWGERHKKELAITHASWYLVKHGDIEKSPVMSVVVQIRYLSIIMTTLTPIISYLSVKIVFGRRLGNVIGLKN